MPTIDFEPKEEIGVAEYVHHEEANRGVTIKLVRDDGSEANVLLPTWLVVGAIVGTKIRIGWIDDGAFEIEVLEVKEPK
jgi:hypothetical protein